MTKRKSECTPEEWAVIRERARGYDAKQLKKPERKKYQKAYMSKYTKTPEYRAADNGRYCVERRKKALSNFRARAYGVEKQGIDLIRWAQKGRCAVCGVVFEPHESGKRHGKECLDHCHDTKRVRGLLCRMCNTFEGFLRNKGLTPKQYAEQLQQYLDNPPAAGLELVE